MTGADENPQQSNKAAKKARQREKRAANKPSEAPQPLIIPGTRTALNQLAQSRRWLISEHGIKQHGISTRRFSRAAINQVQVLFHKDPKVRAKTTFDRISPEAKRVVQKIEAERATALAAGEKGDWWAGERRKGVTPAERNAGAHVRKMLKQGGLGEYGMLGIPELSLDESLGIDKAGYENEAEPDEEGEKKLDKVTESMAGELGGLEDWELEDESGEDDEEEGEDGETSVELADDDVEMADDDVEMVDA